jgi:hypothetical protein
MSGRGRGEGTGTDSPWSALEDPRDREDAEPRPLARIGINGDPAVIARFKRLAKDDRRTYAEMLRILMDAFEKRDSGHGT